MRALLAASLGALLFTAVSCDDGSATTSDTADAAAGLDSSSMGDVSDASFAVDAATDTASALSWDPSIATFDYTDAAALGTWMESAEYRSWSYASDLLPIEATGGSRRIYWNASLAESMERGSTRHPAGSMGVRENFEPDGSFSSFSILIRTSNQVGAGGWLWYERFEPDETPLVHGVASAGCVGCHRMAPADFVFEPDADPFVACRP